MPEIKTHYIVQTASARCSARFGNYGRVAVLEVHAGVKKASMISERSRDVVRVVETWERRNIGSTDRCAFSQALREANEMCDKLNFRYPRSVEFYCPYCSDFITDTVHRQDFHNNTDDPDERQSTTIRVDGIVYGDENEYFEKTGEYL